MTTALTILAYLFSSAIGFWALSYILRQRKDNDLLLMVFLAPGFGLAINSLILFCNFLLMDRLSVPFILFWYAVILIGLLSRKVKIPKPLPVFDLASLGILLLMTIPLWLYAQTYPMGGWDAWQVWNLKAKFLFLGEEEWKNMLDVNQWRSSPHYPLFLPFTVVWGWIWTRQAASFVPLFVAIFFTFLTSGLLFAGLRRLTGSRQVILPALFLLTLPMYVQLATSQYSDIVLSYYLLASVICSILAYQNNNSPMAWISGAFLGSLSFTKPEGTIAALLLFLLNILFLYRKDLSIKENKKAWLALTLSAFIFTLPSILFQLLYSPGNQTFINGFMSAENPSDFMRLKFSLAAFFVAMSSNHWNGIWFIILAGLILGWKKAFKRERCIIPLFLIIYIAIILFYYWLNTHFEIIWWLKNTLSRILSTILPVFMLWAFCAVNGDRSTSDVRS